MRTTRYSMYRHVLIIATILCNLSFAAEPVWHTIQLTNNDYSDSMPVISGKYITWQGKVDNESDLEIFLYDGSKTTQITNDTIPDLYPAVNKNGWVTWQREWRLNEFAVYHYQIFLYDGINTKQLTGVTFPEFPLLPFLPECWSPQINDLGHIVWRAGYEYAGSNDTNIMYYDGTDTYYYHYAAYAYPVTELNNGLRDISADISNSGLIVWSGASETVPSEIFVYRDNSVIRLTNDSNIDTWQNANNNGTVVWLAEETDSYQIYLWNGLSTIHLSSDTVQLNYSPQINDAGTVAWYGKPGGTYDQTDIFIYNGQTTQTILENGDTVSNLRMNSLGQLTWMQYDGQDFEIYLYDRGRIIQLTNNAINDLYPDISDNGTVTWQLSPEEDDTEIFMARPDKPFFETSFEQSDGSLWFGGDDRDLMKPRNTGVGQSITLGRSSHITQAGFRFTKAFDYYTNPTGTGHAVTLALNIRSSNGIIVYTTQKYVPAEFNGGWIIFDTDVDLYAGQEYSLTCYLVNGESLELCSRVYGDTSAGFTDSQGYAAFVHAMPANMEYWGNWNTHSWDFNFRLAGYRTDLCRADYTEDGRVSLTDILTLAANWLSDDCEQPDWCMQTDMNWNGDVNLQDLSMLSSDWKCLTYPAAAYWDIVPLYSQMSSSPISGSDGNEFQPGTWFVYKTGAGRYGKCMVTDYNTTTWEMIIKWVTYNSSGTIYNSGSNQIIHPSYFYDMDWFQETTGPDTDIWWHTVSSTTRYLEPQNGAKWKLMFKPASNR